MSDTRSGLDVDKQDSASISREGVVDLSRFAAERFDNLTAQVPDRYLVIYVDFSDQAGGGCLKIEKSGFPRSLNANHSTRSPVVLERTDFVVPVPIPLGPAEPAATVHLQPDEAGRI